MPRALRFAGLHLALAAMLLRALLPAGWMPDTTGQSQASFVICTFNGPILEHTGTAKHAPGHDDGRQSDICPFAASVHLATPTATAALAPASTVAFLAPRPAAPQTVDIGARHSPQSPRAPPAFA